MVLQKQKDMFTNMVKNTVASAVEGMVAQVGARVTDSLERVGNTLEQRILEIERRLFIKLVGYMLVTLAGFSLLAALFHYLVEFAQLDQGLVFVIIAGVLFALGIALIFIMKGGSMNGKKSKN